MKILANCELLFRRCVASYEREAFTCPLTCKAEKEHQEPLHSRLGPKLLNFFEKERRVQACESIISDNQDVYKQIITGDETWIYGYDEQRPNSPHESRSKNKFMLTVFLLIIEV